MSVDVDVHVDVLSGFVSEDFEKAVYVYDHVHVNVDEPMSSDQMNPKSLIAVPSGKFAPCH